MAPDSQAHFRWSNTQGPHEAQGSHCEQEEARPRQEGIQEPREGGLQAQEGHIQVI